MNLDEAEGIARGRFGVDFSHTGSTHLPVLIAAVMNTTGPVLEMGTGFFSTAVLHELCKGRRLLSFENDRKFYEAARTLEDDFHEVRFTPDYAAADVSGHWSVALIDHDHRSRERTSIIARVDADYMLCHDSEPEAYRIYSYQDILHLFKYRYDYTKFKTHTMVLSNTIVLGNDLEFK